MIPKRPARPGLRWTDLTLLERLALLSGWHPANPPDDRFRWTDWGEFLATWDEVRLEAVERLGDRFQPLSHGRPFADVVRERHR